MKATPHRLYSSEDLNHGFNPWDPLGFTLTADFAIYRQFVIDGGPIPNTLDVRERQAEHDAGIGDALRTFLGNINRPLVGIMGGHGLDRDSVAFVDLANLARVLAQDGFLLVSGGGPGAMEAAHLGAAFSQSDDARFAAALKELGRCAKSPSLDGVVLPDGTLNAKKKDQLAYARDWVSAALAARALAPQTMPISLAIPTWLYGAEPTMPFATHYAKYFQNSIREEALINNSRAGIIYGQGGGGTVREVHQDVERNYYARSADDFTPMIFFDRGRFWENSATYEGCTIKTRGIKLNDEVTNTLKFGLASSGAFDEKGIKACLDKVHFTADIAAIKTALKGHSEISQRNLFLALSGEPTRIRSLRINRG
jgi:predicted Rossmann-fold nucleotide-binding protein